MNQSSSVANRDAGRPHPKRVKNGHGKSIAYPPSLSILRAITRSPGRRKVYRRMMYTSTKLANAQAQSVIRNR